MKLPVIVTVSQWKLDNPIYREMPYTACCPYFPEIRLTGATPEAAIANLRSHIMRHSKELVALTEIEIDEPERST